MSIHKAVHRSLWAGAGFCLVMMGALYFSGVANAQGRQCGQRDQIVQQLEKKYKETRIAVGLVNDRYLMELFASPKGTWTVLMTTEDAKSCVEGAGDNFEFDTTAFDEAKKGEAF